MKQLMMFIFLKTFISSSRDRLAVIDGEVDYCIVRETNEDEKLIIQKLLTHDFLQDQLLYKQSNHAQI